MNAILHCFVSAVHGNVVFLLCSLTSMRCFHVILRSLLETVYGKVVFSRSNMHARYKSLVFLRSLSICSCSFEALQGFGRLCEPWETLGGIARVWELREALEGSGRLCAVL